MTMSLEHEKLHQAGPEAPKPPHPVAHRRRVAALAPGLVLTAGVAGLAFGLRQIPGLGLFSPLILAIVIGVAIQNILGAPARTKAGVVFAMRPILRFGIILLGFQLTAAQIAEVGARGAMVIVTTLVATFLFTAWLGHLLGVDRKLAQLIGAGTAICGASAVIATNSVTAAHDEDVAYAVACVTLFGSAAMFVYPLLQAPLGLDPRAFGLWAGASIHEIAQVVAAAFQAGKEAGDFGTIAKLARVTLLAPVVLTLGAITTRRTPGEAGGRAPIPWFVFGFLAVIGLNSVIVLAPGTRSLIVTATTFLLAMALAAMGLETDLRKLRAKGFRPLLLGFSAFVFVASFSLLLIKLFA